MNNKHPEIVKAKVGTIMSYLMSASLLVTATPTVDSAEDVTWPA